MIQASRRGKRSSFRKICRAAVIGAPAFLAIAGMAQRVSAADVYWDSDANAAGNDAGSGAGLGGSGTWDNLSSSNWWDGSSGSDQQWNDGNGDNAIFWGTAGTVALSSGRTVQGLMFKSDGYVLSGSSINLGGAGITVDTGASTIGGAISGNSGLIKQGLGKIVLSNAGSTYTNGTIINAGTLEVNSSSIGVLGTQPANNTAVNSGLGIRNGSTFRIDQDLTVPNTERFDLSSGGGTIDTNGHTLIFGADNAGANLGAGIMTTDGSGLTVIGGGKVVIPKSNANIGNNTYASLTVNGGSTVKIYGDQSLGAVPASNTIQVTLDNGTLQWRSDSAFAISNTRQIYFGAGGGTFDMNGAIASAAQYGSSNGFQGPGNLTIKGPGKFWTVAFNDIGWSGKLIITNGGTFLTGNEGGLQGTSATFVNDAIKLDNGTLQLGGPTGPTNGNRGITVTANGGTVDTQGNTVIWSAGLTGGSTAHFVKNGVGGVLVLNGNSNDTGPNQSIYSGPILVNQGVLAAGNNTTNAFGDNSATNVITVNTDGGASVAGGNGAVIPQNISFNTSAVLLGISNGAFGGNPSGAAPAVWGDTSTFTGTITSAGGFTKSNPANGFTTIVLTNPANSWTGTTTIAGQLRIGGNNAIPTSAALSLGGGTGKQFTVDAPFSQTIASVTSTGWVNVFGTLNIAGSAASSILNLSGTGTLIRSGNGTLTVGIDNSAAAPNGFSGPVQVTGGTLFLASAAQIGDQSGTNTLTLGTGGTLRATGAFSMSRAVIINAGGGTIDTAGNILTFAGSLTGAGTLSKSNSGTLNVTNIRTAGLNISTGTVHVLPSGDAAASTSSLKSAPVFSGGAAKFDIDDNSVVINYTGASPLSSVRGSILSGRGPAGFGNATWNGVGGIISSKASPAAQGLGGIGNGVDPAIGYGENSAMPIASFTSFNGQTAGTSSILIKYTRGADATLDGVVDNSDVTVIGTEFNNPTSGQWYLGDFDYSGMCDNSDVTALGTLFNPSAPPLSPAQLNAEFGSAFAQAFAAGRASAAVPEPALLIWGAAGMLMVRRRRGVKRQIEAQY